MESATEGRSVKQSKVETVHLVRQEHMNSVGRLHGGTLISWIDDVAAIVARRHSHMKVTTASVDNLRFLRSVALDDTVVIIGKATYVGNTSMEIKVETYVEQINGDRNLVNRAFLTLVGLDDNNKPAKLPPLILETADDKMEWEKSKNRYNIRKKHREEGTDLYE